MSVHPERTYVVTGADSGIGALTARTLQERGARVIRCGLGVDVEVSADLGDDEGRAHLLREVERLAPGGIDGLALVAGLGTPTVETVRVNYFGTLSVLAEVVHAHRLDSRRARELLRHPVRAGRAAHPAAEEGGPPGGGGL